MIITQIIIFLICTLWIIREIITFIIQIIILRKLKNIYNTNYLGPDENPSKLGPKTGPIRLGSCTGPIVI
jgi:hypothetical protein